MPIYYLSAEVTCSIYTDVIADSLQEAIEIAKERGIELHFNGSGTDPLEVWCLEEADGEPEGIKQND